MPDADPRYRKLPRPSSIVAFQRYLEGKPVVSQVQQIKAQLFRIERWNKPSLLVHVTNLYIVSEADVYEILADDPEVDCIVTMSAWNSYTTSAKEMCREQGIGLFQFKEFMGAVYYSGTDMLDYIHPDARD